MAESLILTFAEVEFALRVCGDGAATVRTRLRINPEADSDIVTAAGIASLLARGLATLTGEGATPDDILPGDEMLAITAALSTYVTYTEAAGWLADRPAVLHIFSGPVLRLTLSPGAYGQFSASATDPTVPLFDVLDRFLDLCSVGEGESAVAIRSMAGDSAVSIAIARDAAGAWRVSDSIDDPNSSQPTDRDGIRARLAELLPSQPATTG
jgi:hypothetical protein